MIDYTNCTLEEFWKDIATHLGNKGIEVTLVGGGVATIYSKGKYMSGDLDFVFGWGNNHKEIREALAEIGFTTTARVFAKKGCPFTLDFSSPPVDIGLNNEPEIDQYMVGKTMIKILTPTECIKERLHKAHHWKDEQAFEAALAVAEVSEYSQEKIKKFCQENKMKGTFERFLERINFF